MKKTSFFYGLNYFLLVLLGWLLLFGKAMEVNRGKEKEIAGSGAGIVGIAGTKMRTAMIRVLLMNSDYISYYHPEIRLNMNGESQYYTPESPELDSGNLRISGEKEGIEVLSIQRAQGVPSYHGALEIKKTEKGLLLINELPLEEYLKGVVPSEMPSKYEEEALMAQAVCARTYAVCQIQEGSLREEYEADVDDSVNFQVYENSERSTQTDEAVEKTKGLILCQNQEPITAYYFSTSSGMTSTEDVWGEMQNASYLQSVVCQFDQEEPWSHWSVTIPWATLEERLGEKLNSLTVVKKNSSGAVTGLELAADTQIKYLEGEYEIRSFLAPTGLWITQKNGNTVNGGSLLPSAYFSMETNPGNAVNIVGGGYGHGVGMSQTAANEMAKEGYGWEEILTYFFKNVEIEEMT